MNHLLASKKEKSEKGSCCYCKKVFNNYQALKVHVRAHQEVINARKSRNYSAHFSNFKNIACTIPNPVSVVQPRSSFHRSGNNPGKIFLRKTSPLDFSKLCLNESSRVHASKCSENDVRNDSYLSAMSMDLSSNSCHDEIRHSNPLSSALSMSSATYFFSNALLNSQRRNFNNFPDPAYATSLPDSGLGSNPSLHGLKEYTAVGSLSPGHGQCSGQTEVGKYDKSNVFTHKRGKKHYLDEVLGNSDMINSSKRPQISSSLPAETEEPEKKEPLPPFIEKTEIERMNILKDLEESFSELGISFDDKE